MKKNHLLISSACSLMLITSTTLYAQGGKLDNTFSTDGKVLTQIGPNYDEAQSVAIQADGKIVAAGSTSSGSLVDDFAVVRYNANGTLDNTFSGDGKLSTPVGPDDDNAYALAIQSDGKILVAGSSDNGSKNNFALVRYNSDGTLDNTFNSTGIVTTSIGTGSNDEINGIVIQPDGKIVVCGVSNNDFAVARYNSNGTLDMTFNGQGWIRTDFSGGGDVAWAIALQSDGKIVVAGEAYISGSSNFAVARYNTNGTLDNSFSADGKANVLIGIHDAAAYSVTVHPNQSILLAGFMDNGSDYDFALARFNSGDGSLDNSFSSDGKHSHGILSDGDEAYSVRYQPDGKILAAGYTTTSSGYSFAVVRYNFDGSFDNTFGTSGKVTTSIGGVDDEALAMALQSDGKIVVAGYGDNGSDDYGMVVVRYHPNASTGINETIACNCPVNVYPNPATDFLNLDYTLTSSGLVGIQLLDLQGRNVLPDRGAVMTMPGTHTETINLQSLTPGIYYLVVSTGTEKQYFRIIH